MKMLSPIVDETEEKSKNFPEKTVNDFVAKNPDMF